MKKKHHLIAISALIAGTLALAGCGKPGDVAAPTPTPTPATAEPGVSPAEPAAKATPPAETAPAAAAPLDDEKVLNLFCWSEYVPQTVIDAFTKKTGIKVNVENYESNESMLAKLLSGGGKYDLIQPSEYVIEALIKENLLVPIDHALVPNLKNLAPEFRNMPFDPGNQYSVPWMAGTVGIVVNTELVTDEIKGYNDVFQDKFKQNIVVLDDAREIVSWALETLDIPVNEITDENLEKAKPVISKWLPLVKVYDSDSPKTSLLNGDVALGVVWSGEGALLLQQDEKFKWIVPEEGAHLFIDSLAIPKTATHPKNAMAFMNFILEPEISQMISEEFPYLNPNVEGRKLLTEEQLNNPASFPTQEEMSKMETFQDIGGQAAAVDDLVTTVKVQ